MRNAVIERREQHAFAGVVIGVGAEVVPATERDRWQFQPPLPTAAIHLLVAISIRIRNVRLIHDGSSKPAIDMTCKPERTAPSDPPRYDAGMTDQGHDASHTPQVIWHFTDGKPGHVNQALGLIEALCELIPVESHTIDVKQDGGFLRKWLLRRFPLGKTLPTPNLLIGAGRKTHTAMLAARRVHQCPVVVMMKPQWPRGWFDRCIIPKHDGISESPNTILTAGVVNRVQRASQASPNEGLFLIGGPSKHHDWNENDIIEQVRSIADADAATEWTLTTSRRTPATTTIALQQLAEANIKVIPCEQTGPDWVNQHLAKASKVWVSEDSVSMVYEALTVGAAVGLLKVPANEGQHSRVVAGLNGLVDRAWVNTFDQWQQAGKLSPCPVKLNEAQRCAKLICDAFLSPLPKK